MAINKSKTNSPHQWNKWLRSGAISGVRLERIGKFEALRFSRTTSCRDACAFMKKCGLRGATIEDLEALAKATNATNTVPESTEDVIAPERVPYLNLEDGVLHLSWSAPSENWGTSSFPTAY